MELPLFPLHVVLFPGSQLPLHIFEPRYLEMVEHLLDGDRRFGVIAIRRGSDTAADAETFGVGTFAEIEQVQRTANGTMDVLVGGKARFSLDVRLPDEVYPLGQITPLPEEPGEDVERQLRDARAAVHRYVGAIARLQDSDQVMPAIPVDPCAASHVLAATLQIDIPSRQRILEAADAAERLRMIAETAHREALLLQRVGPPVNAPSQRSSLN
jgi:uncharacterized protein